jgi:hypothetical protein
VYLVGVYRACISLGVHLMGACPQVDLCCLTPVRCESNPRPDYLGSHMLRQQVVSDDHHDTVLLSIIQDQRDARRLRWDRRPTCRSSLCSPESEAALPRINTITCSCAMVYYWMNGVILGYKRKEDIYKLLRNFLSRDVKVASYDRDEIPRVSSGSGVSRLRSSSFEP